MPKKTSKRATPAQVSPVIAVRELRIKLAPSQRLVLYALASRLQSFDHEVWPSVATIAEDTSLSENTARRVMHELVELGILVEQPSDRRTKTFRIWLPTPPMVGVQAPIVGDSHGGRGDSHDRRDHSHGGRGTPPMVGAEDQSEGQTEVQIEGQIPAATTTATLPAITPTLPTTPLSPHVTMIRDTILQDPDLARITPPDAIDAIATDYAAAPIDALATIRSAGDYLRTEPGRTIRNGVDHLRRRLQWAIGKAQKIPPPKPKRAMIDLALRPELMPRPRV